MKAQTRTERVDICLYCGKEVRVMIFRGSHLCSVDCQKAYKGEENVARPLNP